MNKKKYTLSAVFPLLRLAVLMLSGLLTTASANPSDREEYKSQLDAPLPNAGQIDESAFRVLCIGDSITRHGIAAERLGWDHEAGMAASSEDRDYAHRLVQMIQETMPDRRVTLHIHTGGGSGKALQRLSTIDEVLPVRPHLVVIQLGEHEKEPDGVEALRDSYEGLVTAFDNQQPKPIIIATGNWSLCKQEKDVDGHYTYTEWSATVEQTMRSVCEKHGIPFVSVSDLARDPACRGWGTHKGVKWHPNDKAHEGYAQKIFKAYLQNR